eukprot:4525794-Pleurochrysis_carterae.AAC.2
MKSSASTRLGHSSAWTHLANLASGRETLYTLGTEATTCAKPKSSFSFDWPPSCCHDNRTRRKNRSSRLAHALFKSQLPLKATLTAAATRSTKSTTHEMTVTRTTTMPQSSRRHALQHNCRQRTESSCRRQDSRGSGAHRRASKGQSSLADSAASRRRGVVLIVASVAEGALRRAFKAPLALVARQALRPAFVGLVRALGAGRAILRALIRCV